MGECGGRPLANRGRLVPSLVHSQGFCVHLFEQDILIKVGEHVVDLKYPVKVQIEFQGRMDLRDLKNNFQNKLCDKHISNCGSIIHTERSLERNFVSWISVRLTNIKCDSSVVILIFKISLFYF